MTANQASGRNRLPRVVRDRTLVFRVGRERFGLPLAAVIEVVELSSSATPVPGTPHWLAGIINHHGQVIPIIRVNKFMEIHSKDDPNQIILVELAGERLGLAVDQIESLDEVRIGGPAHQGRKRSWHRGAILELIDPKQLEESIKQCLAKIHQQS